MTRILLAEDELVLARNIARALEKTGAEVLHAASAAAAKQALADSTFDLVIIDISLGDGDGLDVIGISADHLKDTPVIVMTGQDSVQNRARAESLSAAAFLSKPFALSRLRELVSALVREDGRSDVRSSGPSVVMYSHDTIGLGHMRRNSAIARELVAHVPDVSVLMLVGCPAGMVFEPHAGIDYVKLPSLTKLGRGVYQSGSLRVDAQTSVKMRSTIIEGVLSSIQPDIFLVDHVPSGAMDELIPTLNALKTNPKVRTVLGLRDILDEPARIREAWTKDGTDQLIAEAYDHLLVYGDRKFFPSAEVYGLTTLKPGNVTECGIVTTVAKSRPQALPSVPTRILVSGGGGRDAYPLIEAAIGAMGELAKHEKPQMTVVTGPLMDIELRTEARRLGQQQGVEVVAHISDFPARMAQASLFVTMTGYNSINEALALGCPILTVPRLGPSAEQRLRAEALERLGLARYMRREDLTAQNLAKMFRSVPPPPSEQQLQIDGVRTAAKVLAGLISDVRQTKKEQVHV